jgi:hypothetical protein
MQIRQIVTPSFISFCEQLQEAVQEGFEINSQNPPTAWILGLYEACLLKREDCDKNAEVFFNEVIPQEKAAEVSVKKPGRPPKGIVQ